MSDALERIWVEHPHKFGEDVEYVRADISAELLNALEMAVLWLEYDGKYDVLGMRAAIAKAKGGTQ